jgi:hypothetical protein
MSERENELLTCRPTYVNIYIYVTFVEEGNSLYTSRKLIHMRESYMYTPFQYPKTHFVMWVGLHFSSNCMPLITHLYFFEYHVFQGVRYHVLVVISLNIF